MNTPSEEDRRLLVEIVSRLSRIEGAQGEIKEASNSRLDRIDDTISRQHNEAEGSRRSLHETVSEMRSKQILLDERVENLTNEVSLMAPMGAVTALNEAHSKLETAHIAIRTSVEELKSTNTRVAGITDGVTSAARGISVVAKGVWMVLITAGGVVGGAVIAAIEHYLTSGAPPPGK